MARTPPKNETIQFSIRLPKAATDMLEELVSEGVYGANRADVAKQIILRYLQDLKRPAGKS